MSIKRIVVLVSCGVHAVSKKARYAHNDALALRVGLSLAQTMGTKLDVLHMGDANNPALGDYLALGAKEIKVLQDVPQPSVVDALVSQLGDADLILTGTRAESGESSGLLPYLLANRLDRPIVNDVLQINAQSAALEISQFMPKGKRRVLMVSTSAIVAIHPLAAVKLEYAHQHKVLGKIVPIDVKVDKAATTPNLPYETQALRRLVKLKAPDNKTGHARMMTYIASESKNGVVVNEGSDVEKAQVLLAYLREHQLNNLID